MITLISLVGRTRFELVTNGLKARYAAPAQPISPMRNGAHAAPKAPKTPHGWQKPSCTISPPLSRERTEMSELLPCPFCGNEARFEKNPGHPSLEDNNDGGQWVECVVCGCSTPMSFSLMEDCRPVLAEIWNRRPDP